ncbi:pyridoxal phosphate-dependent aminotransferase [Alkalilimnicola sp. S0819]|uniref:pyridoxal phosphate-dependent aminotransferase n=1 Tax=Alkalilimnicola sp. S0819 TaxID=2613922 RepID=UPI001261D2CF|nr:aminotransferase class I/II-fold pyridoxal phosphate-dependent enzyme [Alkalilimnicola sp. S0819]KAB7623724.1 aminotransferase class I/II-fold pyridoxal phosphate-dependent enzyme [Alkalilimnicola sp. S0819]MPQ16853.1 aminotransferase class I/II-fold pyridoxal phosphate-dependent enzyme [Alkalilimnicola sp. S0819]
MLERDVDLYDTDEPMWSPSLQAIPVPGIRRMVNLAAKLDDVIHLSIGQPDFPTPGHIVEAHIDALRNGQTGYTMDAGLPDLLTALAEYYSGRCGRELTEDNILITTGATEAMYLALTATAAPGRQFLVTDPAFSLYAPLIRMNGGEVKLIPTRAEQGHQIDPQEVIDNIGMRTFGIVLNSPSNPTGAVYPRETVEAVVQEAAYRGVHVYSDEVYDHIVLDDMEYPSVLGCTTDLDHVMVVSSFSKTFSMPGLRIGWIIASQGHIKKLRRYHMFTTTVANTPAQWAGLAALRGDRRCIDEMVAEYRRRRDRVVQLVAETPHLTGYWPQGGFYIFPSLPPNTDGSHLAIRMLEETGVCVVPGDAFGDTTPNSLRISYSTSMEQIELAFERMIPWLAKQKLGGGFY